MDPLLKIDAATATARTLPPPSEQVLEAMASAGCDAYCEWYEQFRFDPVESNEDDSKPLRRFTDASEVCRMAWRQIARAMYAQMAIEAGHQKAKKLKGGTQ